MVAESPGRSFARLWFYILGASLLLLGLLGFLAPHPLGEGRLHLEGGELWVHLVVGAGLLAAARWIRPDAALAPLAVAVAVAFGLAVLAGLAAGSIGPWHVGAVDNALHLLVALASGTAWRISRHPTTEMAGRPAM